MEYDSYWKLPTFPNFSNPLDAKFDMASYFTQIQKSYCTLPPTLALPADSRVAFAQWAEKNGIKHPKCEYTHLFYSKEGYPYPGLIATEDIHQYEKLVEVPPNALITMQTAYMEYKYIFDAHPDLFCNIPSCLALSKSIVILATYIIAELAKKEKSWIYCMFTINPKSFDTLLTWPLNDIKELQDLYLLQEVMNTQSIMDEYYKRYYQVLSKYPVFPQEYITKQSFYWAIEFILSRAFDIQSLFIAPYIFCLNNSAVDVGVSIHKPGTPIFEPIKDLVSKQITDEYQNEYDSKHPYGWLIDIIQNDTTLSKPFALYSNSSEFKKGEELFWNYNDDDSKFLLFYYGYCNEFNIYDYIKVPVDTILSQPSKIPIFLKQLKQETPDLLEKLAIPVYYTIVSSILIDYAKLLVVKEDEYSVHKCNIKHEMLAVEKAIAIMISYIDSFPTTLKQDMELLQLKPNSSRLFFSIVCRAWGKRIAHHQIYLLRIIMEMQKKIQNGENKASVFNQAMKIEEGMDDFNIKLSRRMILPYYELL
jgi:hypothetical protein